MLNEGTSGDSNPPPGSGFERDLLRRIRSHDKDVARVARAQLAHYCDQQAAPVLRKIWDAQDRQDLGQEVNDIVQDEASKFEDRGIANGLARFIKRTAHKLCLEYFTKRKREAQRIDPAELSDALRHNRSDTTATDLPVDLDRQERDILVRLALDNLKPIERSILLLYYFDGIESSQEIGRILNLRHDHVRQIHSRALRRLRTMDMHRLFDDLCLH